LARWRGGVRKWRGGVRRGKAPCRGRSLGRSAPSEPMKLPSEACMRREALAGSLGCLRRPALSPHLAIFCGKCAHGIMETLAHVPGRMVAPCAAKSSPDGCSANALDNQPAEPAGTAPEPPLVVAKCSVMMGGNWCRADGCLGAQDRNLAALGAAGTPSSRKFRLRRRPWHLCSKINPAIRQISPSSARSYFGQLYSLSGRDVMRVEHSLPSRVGVTRDF
jgi:hypothetical protein